MGLTKNLGWLSKYITADSNGNIGIAATGPNTLLQIGTGGGAGATNSIAYLGGYSSGVSQLRYIMNHNGAANAGIGTPSAGGILFGYGLVDGTVSGEWMRINTSGNVGIGTISPLSGGGNAKWITVDGSTYGGGFISSVNGVSKGTLYYDQASLTFSMYAPTGIGATIHTDGTERVRVFSSGNVFIGSSPADAGYKLDVNGTGRFIGNTTINGASTDSGYLEIFGNNSSLKLGADKGGGAKLKYNSNGNLDITPRAGYNTVFTAGNVEISNGTLYISGGSGNSYSGRLSTVYNYPYVDTYLDSYAGASYEGKLNFRTNSGGGSLTTRMIITSGGFAKISNDGTYYGASGTYHEFNSNVANSDTLIVNNTSGSPYGSWLRFASSPNNATNYFLLGSDGTNSKFLVYSNGNIVNRNNSYGGISDIKYKENIIDATSKLEDIMQLKVRNFNFIGDDTKQIGFIAQEFEEVFPGMVDVSTEKAEEGVEPETYKSIKTSVLIPILVKGIQELTERIKTLENK